MFTDNLDILVRILFKPLVKLRFLVRQAQHFDIHVCEGCCDDRVTFLTVRLYAFLNLKFSQALLEQSQSTFALISLHLASYLLLDMRAFVKESPE